MKRNTFTQIIIIAIAILLPVAVFAGNKSEDAVQDKTQLKTQDKIKDATATKTQDKTQDKTQLKTQDK
ncbi:MAG: hypothetical protein JXR76_32750, partial [Deltaproteobacteria bacterium]|nr:hypothetical protein [Deltaproteobacteria bacterium]